MSIVIDASHITFTNEIINNYDKFFNFLINGVLATSVKINDIKILLPVSLSVSQRHKIHTYSRNKEFYGVTDHNGDVSQMTIFISKHLYRELLIKYSIQKEPVVQEEPKEQDPLVKFRKEAFDKHIRLLEQLYPEEFANFLK